MDGLDVGVMEEKPKSKQEAVITELINHINSLEEKIHAINNSLSEIKDVQLVDKLDIVNLKNEIEKTRAATPNITPEAQQTIEEVHELAQDIKHIKKIKHLEKSVGDMRMQLEKSFGEIENLKELYKFTARKRVLVPTKKPKKQKAAKKSEKGNRRCKKCKSAISGKAKFCTKCGKRV